MLTRLRLYREYRRRGLRRAWSLAGMWQVAWSVIKYVAIASAVIAFWALASQQVQAVNEAADNRVAAKLTAQEAEIDALRGIVAACLGDRDGVVWIGNKQHLCGIAETGVKR